jgi:hypothetical protein
MMLEIESKKLICRPNQFLLHDFCILFSRLFIFQMFDLLVRTYLRDGCFSRLFIPTMNSKKRRSSRISNPLNSAREARE